MMTPTEKVIMGILMQQVPVIESLREFAAMPDPDEARSILLPVIQYHRGGTRSVFAGCERKVRPTIRAVMAHYLKSLSRIQRLLLKRKIGAVERIELLGTEYPFLLGQAVEDTGYSAEGA